MSDLEAYPDPRAELDALTHALTAEVRRRSARGLRRADRYRTTEVIAGPVEQTSAVPRDAQARIAETPTPPPDAPPGPTESALDQRIAEIRARAAACPDLGSLQAAVAACTACELCLTRKQTVFAQGSGARRIMFIGEAPGQKEDEQGLPFVGPAGGLLTDIIEKGMGIDRREVAVANVLKCRPPGNRDPLPAEKALCTPWLDRQIELFDPLVIVPLGKHASNHVLDPQGQAQGREATMGSMRGRAHERGGRRVVPTYHPSYLLRSPEMKPRCWEDIQRAMTLLALPLPAKGRSQSGSSSGGR